MDFRRTNIEDLATQVRERRVSSRELTAHALNRIEATNDEVGAFVAIDGESALAAVHAAGVQPLTALVRRAGLEDVFLILTGRTLVD